MADIIQIHRGSSSAWTSNNPTLAQGELGYEFSTNNFKLGDGSTPWNSLQYLFQPSAMRFNNFTATNNPDQNNDSSEGYSTGSQWLNNTSGMFWVCVDSTSGSAEWRIVSNIVDWNCEKMTDTITITSTSFVDVDDMELDTNDLGLDSDEGAGYMIWFSASVEHSSSFSGRIACRLLLDGVEIDGTIRQFSTIGANQKYVISTMGLAGCSATGLTSGQTISVQWRTNTGTATMTERTLMMQGSPRLSIAEFINA